MSPSNDSGFKVEPFDGSNYALWSFKMRMYLMSKGLWEAVNGTEVVTTVKEQQAHAAIVLNLKDSQLMHVIDATTARDAWGRLARFHHTQDMANRLWLKENFASFKYTASSMSEHVTELEDLVMKMKSASCGPGEEDVCAVLLRSLPASYESLVQDFRMPITNFNLSDLVSKLIAEEVRQKEAARVEKATALYTSNKKSKHHPKKQQGWRDKKPSGACFNCGKVGHYARDCRSSRSPRESTRDQSNVAFHASEGGVSDSWVMDSGASAHMCKDRDAFEDYQEVQQSRSISSAKSDVKLKVLGMGVVKLRVWTGQAWIDARLENTLHVQDLSKNLFSLTAAAARGITVEITRSECVVKRNGAPVATGRKKGFLMYLNVDIVAECHIAETETEQGHRRMGHASYSTINAMIKAGQINGTEMKADPVCDVCATAKQVRKTYKASEEAAGIRESERSDVVVCSDLEAGNIDVDTAFLYGEVDEEIYMDQSDGFEDEESPDKKCLLQTALYGTKQAARQWNNKLSKHLEDQGFEKTDADPCVFLRMSTREYSIIVIYVDDLMIFCRTKEHVKDIKSALKTEFSIKDLGDLKYCLGIEIHRRREERVIMMNQRAYIRRIVEKLGVENCKDVHTPANSNSKLMALPDAEAFVPKFPYRKLVGALMYIATCTRPDIAYAVGEAAKFCECYGKSHWAAAKRILKYLTTTQDIGIIFRGANKGEIIGYADANWAGDPDTRRSTTGFISFLNGSAISWKSKRQPTVATSSTEAEYMSLYSATQEAIWLRRLLEDLRYTDEAATTIFQDNQGCIALAKNPVYHSRTKHIDIKYHYLREKMLSEVIALEYKPTEDMIADGFTKALPREKNTKFLAGMGMAL